MRDSHIILQGQCRRGIEPYLQQRVARNSLRARVYGIVRSGPWLSRSKQVDKWQAVEKKGSDKSKPIYGRGSLESPNNSPEMACAMQ